MAVKGTVYVLESSFGYYKIGCSSRLERRLATFGVQLPFKVSLLVAIEVDDMYYYESWLHNLFVRTRVNGEWFHLEYYAIKLLVEYLTSQEELDKFIAWCSENEDDFRYTNDEYELTPWLLYDAENNAQHEDNYQSEIDRIANKIWNTPYFT